MINEYGVLESRGCKGTIRYSVNDGYYHGKIVDISDLVTYKVDNYEELVEEFECFVLDYMEYIDNKKQDLVYTSYILKENKEWHLEFI